MAISFHPKQGQVLYCDFSGFEEPEIVKKRPVIIISPQLPHRNKLVAVVPISTTEPRYDEPYIVRLSRNYHPNDERPCWAKCDIVMNIAKTRLDRFRVGRRRWHNPKLSAEDLDAVKLGVLHGLGMAHLAEK